MFHHDVAHTGYSTSTAPATSNTLWTYGTSSGVLSSPAVSNGLACVGSDDYNVYALNAPNGALLWKYANGSQVYSCPAVVDGVGYVGSIDKTIYALDFIPPQSEAYSLTKVIAIVIGAT